MITRREIDLVESVEPPGAALRAMEVPEDDAPLQRLVVGDASIGARLRHSYPPNHIRSMPMIPLAPRPMMPPTRTPARC